MATKSTRSSGTQPTQRGVNQGVVVVDPISGLPVTVVEDNTGKKRLAVDAQVTASIGDINVDLDYTTDSVAIGDPNTGAGLKINPNGSVDANVEVDAADGDSIKIVGTEDGTPSGTQHTAKIGSDGNLRVKDEDANTKLSSIDSKLTTAAQDSSLQSILTELGQKTEPSDAQNIRTISSASDSIAVPGVATETKQDSAITVLQQIENNTDGLESSISSIDSKLPNQGQAPAAQSVPVVIASDQSPIPVDIQGSVQIQEPIMTEGSVDGTISGTKYGFVYNIRQQILAAHDRESTISYADFGTKNQRITEIAYSSVTFPGTTVKKQFIYSLQGNRYRRDNINWVVV